MIQLVVSYLRGLREKVNSVIHEMLWGRKGMAGLLAADIPAYHDCMLLALEEIGVEVERDKHEGIESLERDCQ